MISKFGRLLAIFIVQVCEINALLCYSGEQSHGTWLRNLTAVQCRKSGFWCIIKRDLDPEHKIDRWVYGCTTESLCQSGINRNVRRKNAKGMTLLHANNQLSELDTCCRHDLCNTNSTIRSFISILTATIILFLHINY